MRASGTTPLAVGLTVLLLLTSGCTVDDAPDGARAGSAPAPRDAEPSSTGASDKDDLLAALRRTQAGTHLFSVEINLSVDGPVSVTGAFDPVGKLFESTRTVSGNPPDGTSRRIVVGSDHYVLPRGETTWLHVDMSRVSREDRFAYFDMTDPTGLAKFISRIASFQRTGPQAYSGRFDPNSNDAPFLPIGAPSIMMIGNEPAPFTIATDRQGHVISIHVEMKSSGDEKLVMTTRFSGHGKPLSVKAPANVKEADDMYYHD